MSKCWKCGKELGGLRASQILGICPECEILDKISNGMNSTPISSVKGTSAWRDPPETDKYSHEYWGAPRWWRKAVRPSKSKWVASGFAILTGCWGGHWLYIGRAWTNLFFVHVISMALLLNSSMRMFILISPLLNLFFCIFFASLEDDTFLKIFFPDMWRDKQIADQYGTIDNDFRKIPRSRPTWEEAFQSNDEDDA